MRAYVTLGSDQSRVVAEAQAAEAAGFDGVACGEHLFFNGPTSNSLVVLAASAGATSSVRLLSALALAPLYPAALLVKQATTLDVVSRGRLDFGVGLGGENAGEFEAVGVPVSERGPRTDEMLRLARMLWAGKQEDFNGRFTRMRGMQLDPLPAQPGGPPIWVGGRKPGALRRAAASGTVWLPYMVTPQQVSAGLATIRTVAESSGRDPAEISCALYAWGAIGKTTEEARQEAVEGVSSAYNQDFSTLADRYLLFGSPERVLERLAAFRDVGVDCVVFQPTPKRRQDSLDRFAADVMPELVRL